MQSTKSCPDCGEPLASVPWVTGTVWECALHGVRDWWFEPAAPLDASRGLEGPPRPRGLAKLDTRDPFSDMPGG